MKVLQTGDWHLGKKLLGQSRPLEQKAVIREILEIIKNENIEVVALCGDVFDNPTPSDDSIKDFFDFLMSCYQMKVSVLGIAGNHDSGHFFEATQGLMAPLGHALCGKISDKLFSRTIKGITFTLLPYFRSYELPEHPKGTAGALDLLISESQKNDQVLLLHHWATKGEAIGEELSLSASGVDSLSADIFNRQGLTVMAGHLHRRQTLGNITYAGSPLPYRFGEKGKKGVWIWDIQVNSGPVKTWKELSEYRKLLDIELCDGPWEIQIAQELEKKLSSPSSLLSPWCRLLIKGHIRSRFELSQIQEELQKASLEVLAIINDNERPRDAGLLKRINSKNSKGPLEDCRDLFKDFFETSYQRPMNSQEVLTFKDIFSKNDGQEQEEKQGGGLEASETHPL